MATSLGLAVGMDHGWILTFTASAVLAAPQISFAVEGGSGTQVPDLSVEVHDLDEVCSALRRLASLSSMVL